MEHTTDILKKRTDKQNRALHVLFNMLATELNEAGFDMRQVLKEDIEIAWNKEMVKEYIWKRVQKAQLGKDSTTELTTKDIDAVFETINRYLGEKFKLHIPFPSIEEVMREEK